MQQFLYIFLIQLKKCIKNTGDVRRHLYYYRDNNGKEIDLLIIKDNVVYPIEVKKSCNPGKESIKNFKIVEKFGMKVGNGGVICMSKDLFPIDANNNYIPIELI